MWRKNLSHYSPTETKWSVTLSPQIIPPKMELRSYSFSSNLDSAPIEVESGDVLEISLPQNTLNISIELLTEYELLASDLHLSYAGVLIWKEFSTTEVLHFTFYNFLTLHPFQLVSLL